MAAQRGRLFVMSGPAGVGKDTLWQRLQTVCPRLVKSISATTRPCRANEQHGVSYFFLSDEEFQRLIAAGKLLEWAKVHNHHYGTPAEWVREQLNGGRSVFLVIDVQGGLNVKQMFPDAVLIFIRPPRFETLRERLLGRRRDDDKDIAIRLQTAEWELAQAGQYDYQVINDDLEAAVERLKEIVERETAPCPSDTEPSS